MRRACLCHCAIQCLCCYVRVFSCVTASHVCVLSPLRPFAALLVSWFFVSLVSQDLTFLHSGVGRCAVRFEPNLCVQLGEII